MIRGMTGFVSAQFSSDKIKCSVEVKSLNHRYFDVNYFLPIGFGSAESKIRQIIQKQIQRGRVTVSLKVLQKPAQIISINKEAIKKYKANNPQNPGEHLKAVEITIGVTN